MTSENLCPECGEPLPPDTSEGPCPKCLMKLGMESDGDRPPAPSPPGGFVPPEPEELGRRLPQLEVLELLGRGGMGAVYKARQRQIDRVVALKILPPEMAQGSGFSERFTREAKSLAKLNHPNIVTLYEFGQTEDGLFYFIMEYVEEQTFGT